jgi:hypothetical protein
MKDLWKMASKQSSVISTDEEPISNPRTMSAKEVCRHEQDRIHLLPAHWMFDTN